MKSVILPICTPTITGMKNFLKKRLEAPIRKSCNKMAQALHESARPFVTCTKRKGYPWN